jgi:hypothetical protein
VGEHGGWSRIRNTNRRTRMQEMLYKVASGGGDGGIEDPQKRCAIQSYNCSMPYLQNVHIYASTIVARTSEQPKVMHATRQYMVVKVWHARLELE